MKNKGITLIALVITIIVLLILAGITINLTLGEHGILNMAKQAGKNYQNAAEYEQQAIGDFFNEAQNIIAGGKGSGTGTNPGENEEQEDPVGPWLLASKVEVGDYVAYDPTAGVTDTSKLTYTSPVGTGTLHGNGCAKTKSGIDLSAGQTFTVTNNTKWRVLSKDEKTREVVLISAEPIEKKLYSYGAIGYLYIEQELNEICKIYGYGSGANTSKTFTYEKGNEIEVLTSGTITGSGARSINAKDISNITKYDPTTYSAYSAVDGKNHKYGESFVHTVFYPTITTETGKSKEAKSITGVNTTYEYVGSEYLNTDNIIYKILFRNVEDTSDISYYLASRYVDSNGISPGFGMHRVKLGLVGGGTSSVAVGQEVQVLESGLNVSGEGVRPIVYLKTTLKTSGKDASGAWNIIDE